MDLAQMMKLMRIFIQVDFIFQFLSLAVSIATILISTLCVPNSICRTYSLNLTVVNVVSILVIIFATYFKHLSPRFFSAATITLSNYALFVYPFLSTITMFLVYMAFTKPVLYVRIATRRFKIICFALGNVLAFICALFQNPSMLSKDRNVTSALILIQVILLISLLVIMLAFYVLTLFLAVQHMRQSNFTSTQHRNRWNTLKVFIIYSTTPNCFTLMSIPGNICIAVSTIRQTPMGAGRDPTCDFFVIVGGSLIVVRVFFTSFTILFAFREYREAVKTICCRCIGIFRKQEEVTSVTVRIVPNSGA